MSDLPREAVLQGASAAPPVAISTAALVGGMTLQDWLAVATIVYIVLQAAFLLFRFWREWRREAG